VVAGCSDQKKEDEKPKGLDLPAGVTLTEPGTRLDVGEAATVAYPEDAADATALTVTVDEITQGDIADFALFSLSKEDAASTPYYVSVTVTNEGPGTPGTSALPIFADDGDDTLLTANAIVGTFDPCPSTPLPADLPKGKDASQCLVFLLPEGTALASVVLQTTDAKSAISWRPPKKDS